MQPSSPSGTHATGGKVTAWAGIVFALLYLVGVMALGGAQPDDVDKINDNSTKLATAWSKYYADSGHRTWLIVSIFVVSGAALAAVVFGSHLRDRLVATGQPGAGRLAFAGSILLAVFTLAGSVGLVWIAGAKSFGDVAVPKGEIAYLAPQLGFGLLLLGGGAGAALMLVTAGWAGSRSGALPGWLGWAGVVIGVILFFAAAFFLPLALLVLWVLAAAIVGIRHPIERTVA